MERVGTLNVTNGIFTLYTMSGIKYTTGLHHTQLFAVMAWIKVYWNEFKSIVLKIYTESSAFFDNYDYFVQSM